LIHWQFGVDGRAGGDGDFDGGGIVAFAEVGVGPEIVVDLVPSVEPVFAGAEIRKRELAVVAGDLLDGWRGGVGGDEGDDGAGEIGNDAGDVMVPAEGLRTMSMWVEVRILELRGREIFSVDLDGLDEAAGREGAGFDGDGILAGAEGRAGGIGIEVRDSVQGAPDPFVADGGIAIGEADASGDLRRGAHGEDDAGDFGGDGDAAGGPCLAAVR